MKKILARIILITVWTLLILLTITVGLVALLVVSAWGYILYESEAVRANAIVGLITAPLFLSVGYLIGGSLGWARDNI